MLDESVEFLSTINSSCFNIRLIIISGITQLFFLLSTIISISLTIRTIVLTRRQKKLNQYSPIRFLLPIRGILIVFLLAAIGYVLSVWYLT